MITVITVPGSPSMVEELSPHYGGGSAIRSQLSALLAELNPTHIGIVFQENPADFSAITGSFSAWGAPQVVVQGGNYLGELVARYLIRPRWEQNVTAAGSSVQEVLSALQEGDAMIVVADGSAGLTAKAPLALLPEAAQAHHWCEEFLTQGHAPNPDTDSPWLTQRGIVEPRAWLELLKISQQYQVVSSNLLASWTTLGVGHYLATWAIASYPEVSEETGENNVYR